MNYITKVLKNLSLTGIKHCKLHNSIVSHEARIYDHLPASFLLTGSIRDHVRTSWHVKRNIQNYYNIYRSHYQNNDFYVLQISSSSSANLDPTHSTSLNILPQMAPDIEILNLPAINSSKNPYNFPSPGNLPIGIDSGNPGNLPIGIVDSGNPCNLPIGIVDSGNPGNLPIGIVDSGNPGNLPIGIVDSHREKTNPWICKYKPHMIRIRRWKMKKHKLKKRLKKNKFLYLKIKIRKEKKANKIFQEELLSVKKTGENFSALEFVKEQIATAKRGGFRVQDEALKDFFKGVT